MKRFKAALTTGILDDNPEPLVRDNAGDFVLYADAVKEIEIAMDAEPTAEIAGLLLSQFLLFMQKSSIWPCYVFIGDSPQELNSDEVIKLKDGFKTMLK